VLSRVELDTPQALEDWLATRTNGDVVWLVSEGGESSMLVLSLDPQWRRTRWIAPFALAAEPSWPCCAC
jgi:hypothetical protein